jgi:hypothetical protein
MNILIFDMDGVLLQPIGYHRALKETVRQAGLSLGIGDVILTDEQIAHFEALGISSEWHSSALCMAYLVLNVQRQTAEKPSLDSEFNLEPLFNELGAQPTSAAPLQRCLAAVESLAAKTDTDHRQTREIILQAENIHLSQTLKWFQEMILGSARYARVYDRKPVFDTTSYLKKYDLPKLSGGNAKNLLKWVIDPLNGAVIMTNRPSLGPSEFLKGALDAQLGANLVGLGNIPLIGFGDIAWLTAQCGLVGADFSKPAWQHGLAAILAASGWELKKSLSSVAGNSDALHAADLTHLQGSTITVFEDTTSGLIAVQKAAEILERLGIMVTLHLVGITDVPTKRAALLAQGASVYADINQVLVSLNLFNLFSNTTN